MFATLLATETCAHYYYLDRPYMQTVMVQKITTHQLRVEYMLTVHASVLKAGIIWDCERRSFESMSIDQQPR